MMAYYYVWVGGLKGVVQEKDLTGAFAQHGTVLHVVLVRDPETKKSKNCGLVVFSREDVAERAASLADGTCIHGGKIIARGPAEQRRRGYSGKYEGKIGHVPSIANDKRRYTDCIHYVNSVCKNGFNCPYRHLATVRNPHTATCQAWRSSNCTDVNCPNRHPGPNQHYAVDNDPVVPLYALSIHDQEEDGGTIKLATYGEFQTVTMKFNGDWVKGTAPGGDIKAVFNIDNMLLRRRWSAYKSSLPCQWQQTEEHYHGTKLCCNISEDKDLCCAPDCAICQIADAGFDQLKIRTNIPSFQRFGHGFYLSPKSSKCHDYTQGAYGFRALLICDVCVGRKYPLTKNDQSLNGPPDGYHSIHGQVGKDLNYEEIVLPKADAILPKYIVVYRKDDERKIAK